MTQPSAHRDDEPKVGQLVTTTIKLVKRLGAGGMGSVWLAEHTALHTQVVVKFISADLARSAEAVARFTREAAAASQVKSPHVVQTLDHGVREDGIPFIVMEYLEGHDLGEHIEKNGRLDHDASVAVVTQLSRALMRAHERGIVHRDIKPSNVFLCDSGAGELFVKLLDFGIAKGGDVPKLDEGTKTGSMVGSPHYMSPEQIIGDKGVDFRSDLWSLGVVAFEAMTGRKPFDADTVGGLALKIHNEPLPLPSKIEPSLPKSIDEWFLRSCARDPKDRWSSAKEMADSLSMAMSGKSIAGPLSLSPSSASRSAPGSGRELALAQTAIDPVSARSGSLLKSNTGVGVAAKIEQQPSSSRPIAVALALLVLAAGAVVLFVKLGDHPKDPAAGGLASAAAASAPIAADTKKLPDLPSASPVPLVTVAAPSASASASASAKPHPTTKPTTTTKPVPSGSDDDIK